MRLTVHAAGVVLIVESAVGARALRLLLRRKRQQHVLQVTTGEGLGSARAADGRVRVKARGRRALLRQQPRRLRQRAGAVRSGVREAPAQQLVLVVGQEEDDVGCALHLALCSALQGRANPVKMVLQARRPVVSLEHVRRGLRVLRPARPDLLADLRPCRCRIRQHLYPDVDPRVGTHCNSDAFMVSETDSATNREKVS